MRPKNRIEMPDINTSNINRLVKLLSEAQNIAIVTHMRPDGDAIGSSMALHHFLTAQGKKSTVVLPHRDPASIDFLIDEESRNSVAIHEDEAERAEAALLDADLIFCLDFNAFHRTDKLEAPLAGSKAKKVLIDHHLNPARECFDLVFSKTDVSSASELLFHVLMALPGVDADAGKLPAKSGEALMTGMTTDTNNFGNSVYPSTLQMASSLLGAGVDRDRIISLIYNRFNENRLRLMGHMMKDLLTITPDGVAYIVLDRRTQLEYNVSEGDTEGFVNMPLSIEKVKMSILLKEDEGKVRVSVRSKKGTSANRCAGKYFNGGGHENAAGGRLSIPGDLDSISQAAEYIEKHTHTFMTEENEN